MGLTPDGFTGPRFESEADAVAWAEERVGQKIDEVRMPHVIHEGMTRICFKNEHSGEGYQIACLFVAKDKDGRMILTFTPFM